jgi:hypothetical protein
VTCLTALSFSNLVLFEIAGLRQQPCEIVESVGLVEPRWLGVRSNRPVELRRGRPAGFGLSPRSLVASHL